MLRKLTNSPYEENVFLMMKFRSENDKLHGFVKEEIERHGFRCIRADDSTWNITKNVYNPLAVLFCCKFGIALFDTPEPGNFYSPNVAYELGIMQMQQKDCLILVDSSLPDPPFDLIKDLRKKYTDPIELQKHVREWLEQIKVG